MYVEIVGWDQTNEKQRGILPDAFDIKATFTLNQPSMLEFSYPKNGTNVSWLTDDDLPMVIMRVNGTEIDDGRFIVRKYSIDDAEDAPSYKMECYGYMTELADAIVYPLTAYQDVSGWFLAAENVPTWHMSAPNTCGKVMRDLIDAAKARGALVKLQRNFTATNSSPGAAWTSQNINPRYKGGKPLYTVLQELIDRNLCDAKMSGYELMLYNNNAIGTDYTTGGSQKVLWYGRDIATGSVRTVDKTGVFTAVLGQDASNRLYESVDGGAKLAQWGRREVFKSNGNAQSKQDNIDATDSYRLRKGDPGTERVFNWEETGEPGQLTPITNYKLGDRLWLDASPDQFVTRESIRVFGFTVAIDEDGNVSGDVTLGGISTSFNKKIYNRIQEMTFGDAVAGGSGSPGVDTTIPNPPTSPTITQSLFMDPGGQNFVMGTLTWSDPTANTDGSTLVDHARTLVERSVGGGNWMSLGSVDAGTSAISIGIMPQNTTVQCRVKAQDVSGNASAWATSSVVNTSTDNTTPGTCSTPTVTAPLSTLKVVWDGLLSGGGALPTDYAFTEIHVSTTNNFTPSVGTQVGTFRGKGTFLLAGLTPGTVYYCKLIVVDITGNKGSASAQGSASATVTQLLSSEITDAAITAAKLADGAVTTPKIYPEAVTTEKLTVAGFSEQLIANGSMEELSQADNTKPANYAANTVAGGGISVWGTDTANRDSGSRCTYFTLATQTDAGRLYATRPIPVQPGEVYYVSVRVKNSRTAPNSNIVEAWTNSTATDVLNPAHANTVITQVLAAETGHTSYTLREGTITVPAGKQWMTIAVRGNAAGSGGGSTTYLGNLVVRKLIGDALIVNLTASKITAGTLSADVLLGAKLYTGTSPNARVEIDSSGIRAYDDTNKKTVDIKSLDGSGAFEDINISGTSSFGITDDETGDGVAMVGSDGNASFQNVFATGVYVGGDSLFDLVHNAGQGVIARSEKTFGSTRTATGTTPNNLYELSANLEAGRVYEVRVDPTSIQSSPAGETGGFRVKYTSDGSAPTDSSTLLGAQYEPIQTSSSVTHASYSRQFVPSSSGLYRFLFQLVHSSSGASNNVQINSGQTIRVSIIDLGIEPPDTGIDYGATLALTKTFKYPFNWHSSYDHVTGALWDSYPDYAGSNTAQWQYLLLGFNAATKAQILSDLAGYTINWVKMYAQTLWAYALVTGQILDRPRGYSTGMIWAHALTDNVAPASGPANPSTASPLFSGYQAWPVDSYGAVVLPNTFGQNLRDNTATGVRVGAVLTNTHMIEHSSQQLYGVNSNAGRVPYLRINATKY